MLIEKRYRNLKSILLIIVISLFFISNNYAQGKKTIVIKSLSDNAIGNLVNAIQSDNIALRRSGIYFSGKYGIEEVAESLLQQLKREQEPSLRILIVRVLYIIGNDKYLNDIYNIASYDKNSRVKKMASAIYSLMQIENSYDVVENTK